MKKDYLNYDAIAQQYNQRYPKAQDWERGQALVSLAKKITAKNILEVGCGTGYWVNLLNQPNRNIFGLDFSMGMLRQASTQPSELYLMQGTATHLPLQNATFDLVYCVDAIHHFGNHQAFIQEASRLLKPNGVLAVIGHDPHAQGAHNWYIYDYFDTVYDTDLRRYPSGESLLQMMNAEGFNQISAQTVEHIQNIHVGEAVLRDPFLKHNATSQLALLSEELYQVGIERIKQALLQEKEQVVFRSEIQVKMFLGHKK
jgi:ubiquinone/menaquinone biosynthesis C-methylase UbiE